MTFTIKNLNPVSTLPVHGISVLPLTKVDLVAAGIPTATILQSLINGELYNYAQGKQIGIIDINNLFTLGRLKHKLLL